jgi:actin-like ATPase involved in cell morphogenesis
MFREINPTDNRTICKGEVIRWTFHNFQFPFPLSDNIGTCHPKKITPVEKNAVMFGVGSKN